MINREISIARLNAKIYTQRNKLIDYGNLLKERKAELAKVKQQLAIADQICREVRNHTITMAYLLDCAREYIRKENTDEAKKLLAKIDQELNK